MMVAGSIVDGDLSQFKCYKFHCHSSCNFFRVLASHIQAAPRHYPATASQEPPRIPKKVGNPKKSIRVYLVPHNSNPLIIPKIPESGFLV